MEVAVVSHVHVNLCPALGSECFRAVLFAFAQFLN